MPDGVDADVEAMKAASDRRTLDDVAVQAESAHLPERYDSMLSARELGDDVVPVDLGWMTFGADSAPQVIHPGHAIELEVEMRAGGGTKVTKA